LEGFKQFFADKALIYDRDELGFATFITAASDLNNNRASKREIKK
jgi:hypothetical protein